MTARKLIGYGLIAGLTLTDIMGSLPGAVSDWYIMRIKYDDMQHGIKRKNPFAVEDD